MAPRSSTFAFTLVEAMVGVALTTLVALVILTIFINGSCFFQALFNYSDMNADSRLAVDQLTKDVREAGQVNSFSTNNIVLMGSDGAALTWSFDPTAQKLTRSKNGTSVVMLTGCVTLTLDVGQRNVVGGSYNVFPYATNTTTAKVVDVRWVCQRSVIGIGQSEQIQTARVVIRNQQLP